MKRHFAAQRSQFELETLEPRIMLSGEGTSVAVDSTPPVQIVEQTFGQNELVNSFSDLKFQPQVMTLAEAFEDNESDEKGAATETSEVSVSQPVWGNEESTYEMLGFEADSEDQAIEKDVFFAGAKKESDPVNEFESSPSSMSVREPYASAPRDEKEPENQKVFLIDDLESTTVDEHDETADERVKTLTVGNAPPVSGEDDSQFTSDASLSINSSSVKIADVSSLEGTGTLHKSKKSIGRGMAVSNDPQIATQLIRYLDSSGNNVIPTQGEFYLEFEGQQAGPISYDATDFDIQASIEALVGFGNVSVTTIVENGDRGFEVEFSNLAGRLSLPVLSVPSNTLMDANGQGVTINIFAYGWHHEKIQSFEAWDITQGDQNIIIAVVDSGTSFHHSDLDANLWINPNEPINGIDDDNNGHIDDFRGWDFVDKDNDPNPLVPSNNLPTQDQLLSYRHGSHITGIATAEINNNTGISGIALNSTFLPIRVTDSNNVWSEERLIDGLEYVKNAIDNEITSSKWIVNLSLGLINEALPMPESIVSGIQELYDRDALVVMATGNGGIDRIGDPDTPDQKLTNVLVVSSTTQSDKLSEFSNYGKGVDLAAPGNDIVSTIPNDEYFPLSGTSSVSNLNLHKLFDNDLVSWMRPKQHRIKLTLLLLW